jgi:hypothetical protein
MKRRYWAFLAILSYLFVIGYLQTFPAWYWVTGFGFGILLGLISGALLMWWSFEQMLAHHNLHVEWIGWRKFFFRYALQGLRIAGFLLASTIAIFLIFAILQSAALFGGSVLIQVYFGLALLFVNLAVSLTKDERNYTAQFDSLTLELRKIRKLMRRSRRQRFAP